MKDCHDTSELPRVGSPAGFEGSWGSDAIVEQLSRLNLRFIALVPGSSYRGMHDSLVNNNKCGDPEIIMCLHEEHCVAIAHGFAKVTERPMAVALHANVGLMHATMAVYNAFCDRIPVLILGGTGPLDAARRRPWIDWIHTATDQAALIRPFIKFDDQPFSVQAAVDSLSRAAAVASQIPRAPVYICFDSNLQEDPVHDPRSVRFPSSKRHLQAARPPGAAMEDIAYVQEKLQAAQRPLLMFGRVNRSSQSWNNRVALAETYNAQVLTDLKLAAAFPTHHSLHACSPSMVNSPHLCEIIRDADTIVSFDWVDLGGTLNATSISNRSPNVTIIHISLDSALHNGWSKDHFDYPAVDYFIAADVDKFVSALLTAGPMQSGSGPKGSETIETSAQIDSLTAENGRHSSAATVNVGGKETQAEKRDFIYMSDLSDALYSVMDPEKMCLVRIPLGWNGEQLRSTHPLAYLGQDGGAGLGSGPGMAVGAALALKDTDYLPVAILGDGDFLMGSTALWTAARYRLPLLIIVANNASFFNDEVHQEAVAKARGRPVENRGIGIQIDDPAPDITQHAASLGAKIVGPQIKRPVELIKVLKEAKRLMSEGQGLVVIDVQVRPVGYLAATGSDDNK